jgi:hypothetical protein
MRRWSFTHLALLPALILFAANDGRRSPADATDWAQAVTSRMGQATGDEWEVYENDRFGFRLSYPAGLLRPVKTVEAQSVAGRVFQSENGEATLIAGASPNVGGDTLEDYRRFLLAENYTGADIDYAPIRGRWFVLSGTLDDKIFYERVTFACGGKLIYGWRLTYPVAERRVYDRIVEGIHRRYRAGRGEDGRC